MFVVLKSGVVVLAVELKWNEENVRFASSKAEGTSRRRFRSNTGAVSANIKNAVLLTKTVIKEEVDVRDLFMFVIVALQKKISQSPWILSGRTRVETGQRSVRVQLW